MKLVRAVATVGALTAVSRIFGLIRESVMSHLIGASGITDAFLVAFKFPNFFRRFFAEGALNAAFVPQFSRQLAAEGRDAAQDTAERVIAVLAATLVLFVLLVVMATPWIIKFLAPGFSSTPERLEMAISFTRITFPYILFISLSALLSGVLNSLDRFAAAAATPIILNIAMIGAMLFFSHSDLAAGKALSWAVFIAGIIQLGWLYWRCWHIGFRLKLHLPRLTPEVKKIIRLMVPGAISAGVMNVNLFLDMILASLLPSGSISYLHYADRLNQLPLSMFGIAMGTALLPSLSRQIRLGEEEKARASQGMAVEISLQLTIPATVGLIMLSYPLINLLYGLTPPENAAISAALCSFSMGIPAYVLGKIFATSFFARQDTATPFKIALVSIACNLGLNLLLMGPFAHVGLAMATAMAAWINAGLQLAVLHRRGWYTLTGKTLLNIIKVTFCAGLMGGALALARDEWLITAQNKTSWHIFTILAVIICSMIVFTGLGHLTGAFNLKKLGQSFKGN